MIFSFAAFTAITLGATACDISPEPAAEPPEGRPLLLDNVGECTFPVTTTSKRAQAYINQGICLIHSFWFYEAWRSFREAARLDSSCAMAYWGMHESLIRYNSHPRGRIAALRRAQDLIAGTSLREQGYIRASTLLETAPPGQRRNAFIREMKRVILHYPEDIEAVLFLVRVLMPGFDFNPSTQSGEPDVSQILKDLMKSHPDHMAAHHYWVHLIEGDRPELGVASAKMLEEIGSDAGHVVHMPGHIYYRLGQYTAAHQTFIRSFQADSTYMADQEIPVARVWNYVHNLNYLLANCSESGRFEEGLQWAAKLHQVPLVPARPFFFYQGRLALPRMKIRFERWIEAADDLDVIAVNDTLTGTFAEDYTRGLAAFARGMGNAHAGRIAEARSQLDHLRGLLQGITYESRSGESDLCPPGNSESSRGGDAYYSARHHRLLEICALDLEGTVLTASGERNRAVAMLRSAKVKLDSLGYDEPPLYPRPVLESLGYSYLQFGAWTEAVNAFSAQLKQRPHSGWALYGLAQSYARGGLEDKVRETYSEFLTHWREADPELESVVEARAWIERH